MQYQAGYILEAVKEGLHSYSKQNKKEAELRGLLHLLSTFNVETTLSLDQIKGAPSILAVATNILTRGLPTLASVYIEQYFADSLKLTQKIENDRRGSICFPFVPTMHQNTSSEAFFNSLHVIEPRAWHRSHYLDVSDVDSSFERSFLTRLIPDKQSFLVQLLEKQRSRSSFTRDNNQGRVDFSLEVPYHLLRDTTNRYRQQVQLKHHKTYVVEVDGRSYHTDLIDDLKDFEIAQLSRTVSHITEDRVYEDVQAFLQNIVQENYVKLVEQNFNSADYLTDPITTLTLAPFGIARIQRIILQYLMSHYKELEDVQQLRIAVVERDISCAYAAVSDLVQLLDRLNELSQTQIALPQIQIEVYSTEEFLKHPLHGGRTVKRISDLKPARFDLVLDVSLLRREGIFKEDKASKAPNTITIRSAHFTHYKTTTGVISAPPVIYRSVANQLQNEVYEPIEQTARLLTHLLQDIFRKLRFREGQLPILNRALQLKSVIGLLPTGGGKSLTYQLVAMLQPGTTIVIDPIRSLMIDQYNGLKEIGIDKCEFINSTLTTAERNFNQHHLLAKGQLQFLFVSPERFVIDDFRKALDNAAKDGHCFTYAVIDEVHCVSEWGHDFRTPYLNLGKNAQEFCHTYNGQPIPLFGLTATASFDVLADIERELCIVNDDGNAVVRFENSVRDEINYIIEDVPNTYEGLDNLTEKAIRESIGKKKQSRIFQLIHGKESVLETFNNPAALTDISDHSFKNYLPVTKRQEYIILAGNETVALDHFRATTLERLHINGHGPFQTRNEFQKRLYKYGIIVFMPHRQGWLGIRNGYNSHGVFDHPGYVIAQNQENRRIHHSQGETLGYFMGSGDDEASETIDKESFEHLEYFKNNEESVMIATKAFGMGIDKPNVRMTIHINIPQSIESFVQEAGRAGRDGRISTSVILYNNDMLRVSTRPKDPYHLDKDVLMYFHKNSFKGHIKERVVIYELRNKITYPNTSNLQLIVDQANDLFGNEDVQFNIKLGGNNHSNRIFVNTVTGVSIGYVYLDSQLTGIYRDFGDAAFCEQLVEWLKSNLPFDRISGAAAIRNWLNQLVVDTTLQMGLERMLAEMQIGDKKTLPIPFTNRFYSKRAKAEQFFILNEDHKQLVVATKAIQQLIQTSGFSENYVTRLLTKAVFKGLDYPEFIESLQIKDEQSQQKLLTLTDPLSLDIQRAYYSPRSQEDTAKAIYRLISIGIIDSYTIDYQNKLYNIEFTKKRDVEYYNSLEELIARYTSKNVAKRSIEILKTSAETDIKAGKATVISKCLEYLTDFIYDKIKKKREQAINDMVRLCQTSVGINHPLEQSKFVKDEIYYYFNAKYSRRGFIERTPSGNFDASMPDDLDNGLEVRDTIEKYIYLAENEETGEFISNIKHLRGSSMRMLRSNPDKPQYRILKSFSLFILADSIKELISEAKIELVKGLIDWKYNEDPDFHAQEYIIGFRDRIKNHVALNNDIDKVFDDIEDHYLALYYSTWTSNFNKQFLHQE